jgi:NAD(P)-dependent dehydrogenase (short-subunit alcohol dehydrogenase family)
LTFQRPRVLITGSTSGVGKAIAALFASQGADTLISGRDHRRLKAVSDMLDDRGPGRSLFIPADLATPDGPVELALTAERLLGGVDVLVNAAQTKGLDARTSFNSDDLDAVFMLNFHGTYRLSATLLQAMAQRGSGAVVNITSAAAYRGYSGLSAYGASMAALDSLTKSWAAEFGRSGVRVNAVSPGPLREPSSGPTRVFPESSGSLDDSQDASSEDVAAAVAFLASPQAGRINGVTLHVDGGMVQTFGYQPGR